jgi:branched-chain amino acid transport system substrate-binding protein
VSRGALAVTLAASLAACGSDIGGNGGSPAATVGDSTTTTVPRNGDHVLELGVLLPQTGPNAAIGMPMIQAIQLAVSQINAAGGYNGMPVKLVIADEGADTNATKVGLAQLLDVAQNSQIDAVIGPLASADALAALPTLADHGILTCSPASTTTAISQLPVQDLFVRTAPTNALQGTALAQIIATAGHKKVAVMFPDDEEGKAVSKALADGLASEKTTVTGSWAYDPSADDFSANAATALKSGPDAVVVIGAPKAGPKIIGALSTSGVPIYVNSGLRIAKLGGNDPTQKNKPPVITGVSVAADPTTGSAAFRDAFAAFAPGVPTAFTSYAYDCATLIAMAAVNQKTDAPSAIRTRMIEDSRGGVICRSFADCTRLAAAGHDIDYDGASGQLELGKDGSPTRAEFDVFGFDEMGKDVTMDHVVVTAPG